MPQADLAAIIESLPPLRFVPAEEAPVSLDAPYLIPPNLERDWSIAYRTEDGWALTEGELIDAPLVCMALPELSPRQRALESLAEALAKEISCRNFDVAARVIDELADLVRAVRDSPLGRLAG